MKINHPPGNALAGYGTLAGTPTGPTLGGLSYHDPVYDESGGQGSAVDLTQQQQNPGALMLVAVVVLLVVLFGDENG